MLLYSLSATAQDLVLSSLCYSKTLSCLSGTPRTLSQSATLHNLVLSLCYSQNLVLSCLSAHSPGPCLVSLLLPEPCFVLSLCYSQDLVLSLLLPGPCFVSSLCYSQDLVLSSLCYSKTLSCFVSLLLSITLPRLSATPRILFCLACLPLPGPCLACLPLPGPCLVSLLLPGPCLVSLLLPGPCLVLSLCYSQDLVLPVSTPRTLSCLSATPRTLSCLSATPRTISCPRERETELQNFSHLESGEGGKWSISTVPEPRPQNWITSCVLLIQLPSPAMYWSLVLRNKRQVPYLNPHSKPALKISCLFTNNINECKINGA